eukprot:TRINITY_DN4547_c0_g2_i4.p2 TRINITY_DN4547_c0_g2~~TRINITY_DN4547_c0_g2_i4.p2  ORF type:complete len:303 (-),score=-20.18 TRINITY_DN4547_c0_g2_i4:74-982(-)
MSTFMQVLPNQHKLNITITYTTQYIQLIYLLPHYEQKLTKLRTRKISQNPKKKTKFYLLPIFTIELQRTHSETLLKNNYLQSFNLTLTYILIDTQYSLTKNPSEFLQRLLGRGKQKRSPSDTNNDTLLTWRCNTHILMYATKNYKQLSQIYNKWNGVHLSPFVNKAYTILRQRAVRETQDTTKHRQTNKSQTHTISINNFHVCNYYSYCIQLLHQQARAHIPIIGQLSYRQQILRSRQREKERENSRIDSILYQGTIWFQTYKYYTIFYISQRHLAIQSFFPINNSNHDSSRHSALISFLDC